LIYPKAQTGRISCWETYIHNRLLCPQGVQSFVDDGIFGVAEGNEENSWIEKGWLVSGYQVSCVRDICSDKIQLRLQLGGEDDCKPIRLIEDQNVHKLILSDIEVL
jgi:hypothetical protein